MLNVRRRSRFCLRVGLAALAMSASACSRSAPETKRASPPVTHGPAPPVGLYGVWVGKARRRSVNDTLVLLADSVARGWNREADGYAIAVSRWHLRYLSKDPVDSRHDWNGLRYQDGGDLSCVLRPDATCVSLPELCLGDGGRWDCMGFRFLRDSLALSNGERYRRVAKASTQDRPH